MNTPNLIRSLIFFIAGLIIIFFPEKVYKFQNYIIKKLHIKYNVKKEKKHYSIIGFIFIIISVILFVFSIIN